jgi:iron complex outermembrane receptor protein
VDYDDTMDNLEVLPTITVAYDLADGATAYATWSQGYLAGGYNYNLATSSSNLTYDPEYTTNYEIGLKTAWLGGALTVNTALFHIEMEDKQVMEGTGNTNWKITNAGKAHSTGGELEARWTPLEGLALDGGVGYVRSVVDEWTDSVSGTDYAGKRLPWVPELTWNVGAGYTHSSGLFARADVSGVGKQYFDAGNTLEQTDYQTVDLRTGYAWEGVTLTLWARNLFDARYATKKTRTTTVLLEDGAPRTFGATVEWRF